MNTGAPSGGLEGTIVAGKYQLVRLLGQGGMGAVYEGRNSATLKRCAVKFLLSPELGRNSELVRRFFREAQASSIVESDHIVQVYDSGADPVTGLPYMVMEMLQGEDLEHTLHREGALDPIAAAKLILQASFGLAKAHEAGIVHRDIKPANLFLTSRDGGDLLVKVLDFGIAKVKMENLQETSTGLTRTGSMLGTPLYMSPEQVRGASSIDARSDVWSLGIVLFELLTGSIPWTDANSLGSLMAAIMTEELPLVQDRAPWIPPELAEITHRAISRDASRRYQHAGELRDALQQILPDGARITPGSVRGVPAAQRIFIAPRLQISNDGMLRATARTGLSSTRHGVPTPTKSHAFAWAALAMLGLGAVGGGGYLLRHRAPAESNAASAEKPITAAATPAPAVAPVEAHEVRHFKLTVAPPEVLASIDGVSAPVESGQLEITGEIGSTHSVSLTLHGKVHSEPVVITSAGVVPGRVELAGGSEPAPHVAAKPGSTVAAAGKASAPAPAAAPAAKPAAAKPASGLANSTDEFGK